MEVLPAASAARSYPFNVVKYYVPCWGNLGRLGAIFWPLEARSDHLEGFLGPSWSFLVRS